MTAFVFIGVVMALAAVLCVVLPLSRAQKPHETSYGARQSNLSILKDQLAELEADVGAGSITLEQHASARAELERRVLEEAGEQGGSPSLALRRQGRWMALSLAVAIPLAAVALYSYIGRPDAISSELAVTEQSVSPAEVEQMVAGLAARLEKNPDDPRGWMMLARSYYVLQRMPEAAAAYAKAAEKIDNDADLLADFADALAMTQGKSLSGKPLELVMRALKLDPSHPKALAMAGTEAFYRKDYPNALAYWEKLLPLLPPDSEMAKSVAGGIAEAREFGRSKSVQGTVGAPKPPAQPPTASGAGASVSGKITLASGLAPKAGPEDTLFIVARALNGPRMPVAVLRRRVADLPLEFSLDDSLAMSPELKLSAFPEVVVTARISKSGNAIPQSGDLQGASRPVKVGTRGLAITIDTPVP